MEQQALNLFSQGLFSVIFLYMLMKIWARLIAVEDWKEKQLERLLEAVLPKKSDD